MKSASLSKRTAPTKSDIIRRKPAAKVPTKVAPKVTRSTVSKTVSRVSPRPVTRTVRSVVATRKVSSPYMKRMKRAGKQTLRALLLSHTFHTSFKVIVGLMISGGLLYGSYSFIGKSFANEVVISKSEIVAKVSKLTALPNEEPYDIVRVQDPEDLKKQNDFYKDIEEGDYILMYSNLAVIYNLRSNEVVAKKVVDQTAKTTAKQGGETGVTPVTEVKTEER